MIRQSRSAWALLVLGLGVRICPAAEQAPYSDTLAHDWWGLRTTLLENGVDFRIGYISQAATNVQGGERELWRNADQWDFSTGLDLQRILGLDAAQFEISITKRDGRNLSIDASLGSLQEVQGIYGRGQTWRWTQLWYDQQYVNGLLDWKVGRLTVTEDFAAFSCEFENLTFCSAAPGNFDIRYWYNWPLSEWGSRLQVNLAGFGYVKVAAYEVDPNDLAIRYGLRLGLPSGATGALIPVEMGWLPTFGAGLDGSYKLGVWYNSSPAPDVSENSNHQPLSLYGGAPLMHHGQFGGYVNFLQRLTGSSQADSERGLRVFANAAFTDRRTSALDSQIALGLLYTGIAASRPLDELGAAIGRTHDDDRAAAPQTLQRQISFADPGRLQGSEYVAELFYGIHAVDGVVLRPNVQFIHQPGGVPQSPNDAIVGLTFTVDF
jgi:porin